MLFYTPIGRLIILNANLAWLLIVSGLNFKGFIWLSILIIATNIFISYKWFQSKYYYSLIFLISELIIIMMGAYFWFSK
jgi:hypothetical protein